MQRTKYIEQETPIRNFLYHYFNEKENIIIFDIGSCEGLDSIRYSNLFPYSKIYSFEPILKNFERIQFHIQLFRKKNIFPYNFALSDYNGEAEMFISSGCPDNTIITDDWDYGNKSSSLLKPHLVNETHSWLKFKNTCKVQTKKIKTFCEEELIEKIDFIHLDVQGAELMVLKGAEEIIHKIGLVWLEVEVIELYKKQVLKPEIEFFFSKKGFFKIFEKLDNVSGDQLYVNKRMFLKRNGIIKYLKKNIANVLKK